MEISWKIPKLKSFKVKTNFRYYYYYIIIIIIIIWLWEFVANEKEGRFTFLCGHWLWAWK